MNQPPIINEVKAQPSANTTPRLNLAWPLFGGMAGFAAAFFSTRRTWLGDVPFKDWIENLKLLNAESTVITYCAIGIIAGFGLAVAIRGQRH